MLSSSFINTSFTNNLNTGKILERGTLCAQNTATREHQCQHILDMVDDLTWPSIRVDER